MCANPEPKNRQQTLNSWNFIYTVENERAQRIWNHPNKTYKHTLTRTICVHCKSTWTERKNQSQSESCVCEMLSLDTTLFCVWLFEYEIIRIQADMVIISSPNSTFLQRFHSAVCVVSIFYLFHDFRFFSPLIRWFTPSHSTHRLILPLFVSHIETLQTFQNKRLYVKRTNEREKIKKKKQHRHRRRHTHTLTIISPEIPWQNESLLFVVGKIFESNDNNCHGNFGFNTVLTTSFSSQFSMFVC